MKKFLVLSILATAFAITACGDNIVPGSDYADTSGGGAGAGECFENCPDAGTGGGSGSDGGGTIVTDGGSDDGSGSGTTDGGSGNGSDGGGGATDAGSGDGSGSGSGSGSDGGNGGATCDEGQVLIDGVCEDD